MVGGLASLANSLAFLRKLGNYGLGQELEQDEREWVVLEMLPTNAHAAPGRESITGSVTICVSSLPFWVSKFMMTMFVCNTHRRLTRCVY